MTNHDTSSSKRGRFPREDSAAQLLSPVIRGQPATARHDREHPLLAAVSYERRRRRPTSLAKHDLIYDIIMTKIKRGGFIFVTWIGDHGPHHVHVFRDGRLVVKWDVDGRDEIEGTATRRIRKYIAELVAEERL